MRNMRISIIALFAIIGLFGSAWALFEYEESSSDDTGLGVNLETYTEVGTIEIDNVSFYFGGVLFENLDKLSIDNHVDMEGHYVLVTVNHFFPTEAELPLLGVTYHLPVVTFENEVLATYLTASVSITNTWVDIVENGFTVGSTATFKVMLTWNENMEPTNKIEWDALNSALQEAEDSNTAEVTFFIEVTSR